MIQVRDILGVAMLIAFLLVAQNLGADPGVGWHLRTGEWILTNKAIPQSDMFLWGESPRPWVHDQWLSDLLFWKIYTVGGLNLLKTCLLGSLIFCYLSVLGAEMKRIRSSSLLIFFALALLSPLVSLQWFVRPLAFSFLFFQLLYVWLLNGERRFKVSSACVLLVLFALWANLHAGFICGLLMLGTAAISGLLQKDWPRAARFAAYFLLAFLGTLINPYGLRLWHSALSLLGNPFFMQLNSEWQRPDFADSLFWPLWGFLLLFIAAALKGVRFASLFEALLLLGFAALALFERRMIPYFGIVASIPFFRLLCEAADSGLLPQRLDKILKVPEGKFVYLLPASGILFVALVGTSAIRAQDLLPSLPGGIEEFAREVQGGKVLHSPDLGGLLTFYQIPGLKAHIDDRNQLCAQADYEEYLDLVLLRNAWREKLNSYTGAILASSDPLARQIENEGWRRLGASEGNGETSSYFLKIP